MEGEIGLVWFRLKEKRKINGRCGVFIYREERKFHQIYLLIFVIFFRLVLSLITIVIRLFFPLLDLYLSSLSSCLLIISCQKRK